MSVVAGHPGAKPALRMSVLLAVLGIVYGDIGTSPLYAFKTSIGLLPKGPLSTFEVLGVLSLIFWSLFLVVTVKYVLLVMRADNGGEGGILALMALAQRVTRGPRARQVLGLIGIGGACLFFGDGCITPAISVLSAVEGLEVSLPQAKEFVIPASIVIIVLLFAVQRFGTSGIGRVFGPIMVVWFATIGVLGGIEIVHHPAILQGMLPSYAILFCVHHGWLAFICLGAVVLSVTGA